MTDPLPVILLHSAGRTPQMWQDQVEAIATRVPEGSEGPPVVAPWLAGLRPGRQAELSLSTAAEEVLTTMDRHGITSARLVGHQLGAMVALQVATTEPDAVAGMMLSGALLSPSPMAMRMHRTVIRLMPKSGLAGSGATKADLLRALELIATADFGKRLDAVTAPVVIVAGSTDPGRAAASKLAKDLPAGRYVELAGAGANPNTEAQDSYNSLLLDFLFD
ncbi:MAG: alpha/beta hydrolase [Propionicimonas sp.]